MSPWIYDGAERFGDEYILTPKDEMDMERNFQRYADKFGKDWDNEYFRFRQAKEMDLEDESAQRGSEGGVVTEWGPRRNPRRMATKKFWSK
jgi:hypothetical protein